MIILDGAFYGARDSIQREREKITEYGRAKPLSVRAVYPGPPVTGWKENFQSSGLLVMKNFGAFSFDTLSPLRA